jgi:hypothetical protein
MVPLHRYRPAPGRLTRGGSKVSGRKCKAFDICSAFCFHSVRTRADGCAEAFESLPIAVINSAPWSCVPCSASISTAIQQARSPSSISVMRSKAGQSGVDRRPDPIPAPPVADVKPVRLDPVPAPPVRTANGQPLVAGVLRSAWSLVVRRVQRREVPLHRQQRRQ